MSIVDAQKPAKIRVLVVDDEPTCAEFLSLALEAEGFEVKSAITARAAIEIGSAFRPEFLVTDWMLKCELDGVDVAKILSDSDPFLKVVFITGVSKRDLENRAAQLSYEDILTKPVDLDQVVALLH